MGGAGLIDQKRLDEIHGRCAAATPGPWQMCGNDVFSVRDNHMDRVLLFSMTGADGFRANAEFAAHARQDIPDLLAEVERLRGVSKDAVAAVDAALCNLDRLRDVSEQLRLDFDAAMAEIPKECATCKYYKYPDCNRFYGENPATNGMCISTCKERGWAWRGPRKGEL